MENLLFKTAEGVAAGYWGAGLSKYTQSNCQVTLVNGCYRIYRPANLTVSANGSTMWGGLVLQPYKCFDLQKGHTYVISFHVKGKSSNAASDSLGFHNQVGGDGGGLEPKPSNVEYYNPVGTDFNGEGDFWYKFTINDDVYKVCTSSYSGFVAGNTYLSYNGFKFGFGYTSTGSMGTDLYITNIRMYDITDDPSFEIPKNGVIEGQLIEGSEIKIMKTKDLITNNFIEI